MPADATGLMDSGRAKRGYEALAELALDLHWSWNHCTDELWRRLDAELWERTQNPWAILQTVSRSRIEAAFGEADFAREVEERLAAQRKASGLSTWFQNLPDARSLDCVAYFSMEFMLAEALPIYAGGLGNVAGDQLKAASDLGVPVVGVGLLYQRGYFRQLIDGDGRQRAVYPYNDPDQLPLSPLRRANGEWLRFKLDLSGHSVWIRGWQAKVRRTTLYLLDTNDPANPPASRTITGDLYGGDLEQRLMQEIVLGIGGWRLLAEAGVSPDVCHLNEGHAAFAALERARAHMAASGQRFAEALATTRVGNVFTTHTAVPAGFDRFPSGLVERALGAYVREQLGVPVGVMLALGRANPDDVREPFNMAYLAAHSAGTVNGVSRLHGEVSRRLFQPLFPRWPEVEVPVGHVTNGVHMPTWDSPAADAVWTAACGKDRWLQPTESLERDIRTAPDATLWDMRRADRRRLLAYVRRRLGSDAGGPEFASDERGSVSLDPEALTLGFARRFATYKRPNLLLRDPERLLRLLTDSARPVQLIVAGKAHPADAAGQDMVQQWVRFAQRPEARGHIVFLADYDMLLTEHLVRGVDVWVNTPRRPWEASGTSGMKVLVNGGLNVSELDGWWAEAYAPELGWALGDGREHDEDPAWDAAEAAALYELLESAVVPEFYARDERGIPSRWVARMRESMARLTPRFSSNRAVREYTLRYYLPAAMGYRRRGAVGGGAGAAIARWQARVAQHWSSIRFDTVAWSTAAARHSCEVTLMLGALAPQDVRLEAYADGTGEALPVRQSLDLVGRAPSVEGAWVYRGAVDATRAVNDYTVRVVPAHPDVRIPLEMSQILWSR